MDFYVETGRWLIEKGTKTEVIGVRLNASRKVEDDSGFLPVSVFDRPEPGECSRVWAENKSILLWTPSWYSSSGTNQFIFIFLKKNFYLKLSSFVSFLLFVDSSNT